MKFSIGYTQDIRRAVGRLEQWCRSAAVLTTVEAIKKPVAGRFIYDQYIAPQVDATTANKDISCLHSYWEWMQNRHNVMDNPWRKQRIGKKRLREAGASRDKRPFTNDEVRTLLGGVSLRREWEFSLLVALSGLRISEVGALRVRDCADGKIAVNKSKSPSGVRVIPAYPMLRPLIERRCADKEPNDYLFGELPEQQPLSLSQTQSDWQLIENRAMLLGDESSCQAHCLDSGRFVSVAGSARDGNLDVAAADERSAANRF
jgi:integrase